MERTPTVRGVDLTDGETILGLGSLAAFLAVSTLAAVAEQWKLLAIAWVAFVAMAGGALIGARVSDRQPNRLVWGYGLASGAMITSAAVFLVPQAISQHAKIGGFGIAAGVLVGYNAHTIGHRLTHLELPMDTTATELAAHALSAGLIIGVIYGAMPELGLLLGLAIVSHKGPAGYAAARRSTLAGESAMPILLPAAGVGLTAIPVGTVAFPDSAVFNAAVFGFASGVFLHVAMDFLPTCEVGGEIDRLSEHDEHEHAVLDRMRTHALASTTLGGLAVLVAWLAVAP
ncbi:ZIP family metal transporter [Halapricum desulfuricans]|uniref:Putative divalent heavy-metal cations transporter n=1 Tax=Halapricum desulfuricans TaxID=2841257 RepID=A0A897NBE6_9EURY|nr:ZIP family metal transporter [Halapricum desulfuricans]QSG10007.1 putative divalent heavy-metal cations transporter [Halapricum desulfuricans]